MRKLVVGVVALLTLALTGCMEVQGTVTEKEYEEGYYTTAYELCGDGTNKYCVRNKYEPECYKLHVRTAENKMTSTCVRRVVWDKVSVGDYYDSEKQ